MPMNFQPFSPDELAAVETLIEKISVGGHGEWIVPSKLGLTNIFRLLATAKAGGTPTSATLRAPINAEFVARRFHHWYETFAPKFGYTTRRETACPFDALPSANRDLMVATCEAVVRDIAPLFAAQESTQTTLRAPEVADIEPIEADLSEPFTDDDAAELGRAVSNYKAHLTDTKRMDWLESKNAQVRGDAPILPPSCGYSVRQYIDQHIVGEKTPQTTGRGAEE